MPGTVPRLPPSREAAAPGSPALPAGQLTYIFPAISAAALSLCPWWRRRRRREAAAAPSSQLFPVQGPRAWEGEPGGSFPRPGSGQKALGQPSPAGLMVPRHRPSIEGSGSAAYTRVPASLMGPQDLTPFSPITPRTQPNRGTGGRQRGRGPMKRGLRAAFWKRALRSPA